MLNFDPKTVAYPVYRTPDGRLARLRTGNSARSSAFVVMIPEDGGVITEGEEVSFRGLVPLNPEADKVADQLASFYAVTFERRW